MASSNYQDWWNMTFQPQLAQAIQPKPIAPAALDYNNPGISNYAPQGMTDSLPIGNLMDPSNAMEGGLGSGINDWMKSSGFLGGRAADGSMSQGWGGMALSGAQGITNAYMGMKQYGLAKDTFNENKRQFALNYDAQKKTTNSHLEDRQAARVASNPNAYQSVGDYMKKNGI